MGYAPAARRDDFRQEIPAVMSTAEGAKRHRENRGQERQQSEPAK